MKTNATRSVSAARASAPSAPPSFDESRAIAALAALAQPTRLAVFRLLIEHAPSGLTAGAIADALGLAPATLSFHLKELAGAGLVVDAREGRFVRYRASLPSIGALVAYLTEHCCAAEGDCPPACSAPAVARPPRSPR